MSKYTHIAINLAGWFYFLENPYSPNNPIVKRWDEDGEVIKDKIINCFVLGCELEGGTIFLSELESYCSIYQLKKPIEQSRGVEILERCKKNQGITARISYNPSLFWEGIEDNQELYLLNFVFARKSEKNNWCKRLAGVYGAKGKGKGIKIKKGEYLNADHPPLYTSSMGLRTIMWQILISDKKLVKELAVKS